MGGDTDDMREPFLPEPTAWVDRSARVKREIDIPVTVSWNLGVPQNADQVIRDGRIDIVLLGRPALANPHWPVWPARELGHKDPFELVAEDWGWWLQNFPRPRPEHRLARRRGAGRGRGGRRLGGFCATSPVASGVRAAAAAVQGAPSRGRGDGSRHTPRGECRP